MSPDVELLQRPTTTTINRRQSKGFAALLSASTICTVKINHAYFGGWSKVCGLRRVLSAD